MQTTCATSPGSPRFEASTRHIANRRRLARRRHLEQLRIRLIAADLSQLVTRLAGARIPVGSLDHHLQILSVPLFRRHLDGPVIADRADGNGGFDAAARDGLAIELTFAELHGW